MATTTRSRVQKKVKLKHRAVKPRPVRLLDEPKKNNHAARHEAKKVARAAHEALLAKQAAEKAEREELAALEDAEAATDFTAVTFSS